MASRPRTISNNVSVAPPPLELDPGGSGVGGGGGGGGSVAAVTATATERVTAPPCPVHCMLNVLFCVSAADCSVPDIGLFPAHASDATHPVARLEDQVSVVLLPEVTVIGAAVSVKVGAAASETAALF